MKTCKTDFILLLKIEQIHENMLVLNKQKQNKNRSNNFFVNTSFFFPSDVMISIEAGLYNKTYC